MREKYEERIPDPGERFSYVIIKGERCRDDNGRLIPYKVADYMQFPDIAKEFNMEIDINYYLENRRKCVHALLMKTTGTNHLHCTKLCKSRIWIKGKSGLMHIRRKRL
jgi:DNA polymerase elongation subunit (family B)